MQVRIMPLGKKHPDKEPLMSVSFPPKAAPTQKKLLVLDLDETLVHSRKAPLDRPADFHVPPFSCYIRPGATEFIRAASRWYEVAVWTASTPGYAHRVVRQVFPDTVQPRFVLTRNHCRRSYDAESRLYNVSKPLDRLEKLGFDLSSLLLVDNRPDSYFEQPDNGIPIEDYLGAAHDTELGRLLDYLEFVAPLEDVRMIDKTGWREMLLAS